MVFLFINIGGDWESIAQRVKAEGHSIYYFKSKENLKGREDTGVGIFEKDEIVDDFWEVINKTDKKDLYILFDDNGYGDMADFLRLHGYHVIGGSAFCDKIEHERSLGTTLMKIIGLKVPPTHVFDKIDDGIKFVMSQPEDEKFVFKPEGEEFAGSSKTYTSKGQQDLVDYLRWIKENELEKHYTIAKYELQEFIEGEEADFGYFFNGEDFVGKGGCIDIEEKKSADGNKGQAIGCAGNVVLYIKHGKFYDQYVSKLIPFLRKVHYVGQISINCIFSSKDGQPYGLEFTPRFGWDSVITEFSIYQEDNVKLSDFFMALANKTPFEFDTKKIATGVRVFTGSITLDKEDVSGRYFSFPKRLEKYLWFYSVAKKEGSYTIEDNPVLVANYAAPTLQKSIDGVYKIMKQLNIPDILYRMEIGQRAEEVLTFLRNWGWC
jgi:phosphoribosylamine--glycine ligase